MFETFVRKFIVWAIRRSKYRYQVVTFEGKFSFYRWEPFWPDEIFDRSWDRHKEWFLKYYLPKNYVSSTSWTGRDPWHKFNRPPFWRPFNALLHCWRPEHDGEEFHDHPRWSITIMLRGSIIEDTPWSTRVLVPGSVVFRSRKAIHSFRVLPQHRGKSWTLFIVGRRNYRQNTYHIVKR